MGISIPPDPLCMVLEYCKEGSLHSLLKSNKNITIEEMIRISKDIARGMLHLHTGKKGFQIIHRDLAARNVLVLIIFNFKTNYFFNLLLF